MATTNPTRATDRAERTAEVHRLAAQHLSHRAIARRLGIHHTTVGRILSTTTAPRATDSTTERTTPAPAGAPKRTTAPTSGDGPAPRLLHPLDPRTIQDLNCLMDARTGALPPALVRAIRTAADEQRARMRAVAHRLAAEHRAAQQSEPEPAQVAP